MRFALRAGMLGACRCGLVIVACSIAASLPSRPASAAQVLGYRFNETGNSAVADAIGNPPLNFFNNSGAAADLHAGPGSGVSGSTNDRAFDNTASNGILTASHGRHAADFDPIDGFTSFTLSGWFKLPANATESIGRQDALIENGTISVLDAPGGFRLRGGAVANSGRLELRVNRDFEVESSADYTEIGQYVNFAVTYDGTKTSNNVQFFKGTTTSPLALVSTRTLNAGNVQPETIPLSIGVTRSSGLTFNPFNGLLDNIRIFDSIVPLADLEALRFGDVNVPEPSAALLVLAGLVPWAATRRISRRRRDC